MPPPVTMRWGAHLPENVGEPMLMRSLLEQALSVNPDNPALHAKLGYLHFDRKDFASAASHFERALELDPGAAATRRSLARCYNYLQRYEDTIRLLAADGKPMFERGRAQMELGDSGAEGEFRAVLARDPHHVQACRMLCRLLRKSENHAEIVAVCQSLARRGAANAQLFYNWGSALTLVGEIDRARRLLFDPAKVVQIPLWEALPDKAAFNAALSEEILTNPNQLSNFPVEDEANRGSRRVDDLLTGRQPDLVRSLLAAIQNAVSSLVPPKCAGFDPWPTARPKAARLRPWGLIQQNSDYEEGHIHPSGWLSGVYYVRVPEGISVGGAGRGCIEFQLPSALTDASPTIAPSQRYLPQEGMLLMAPSHYRHRTIPSGIDEYRISVAFDVVPDACDHSEVGRQA